MKNRGIIKRLVFGKQRENDLTEADLPSTRPKLFAFVMRTRFGIMFRANLLAALFFLPFIAWDVYIGSAIAAFVQGMTAAEYFSNLINLTLLHYGVNIVFIMIGCVGLAGLLYVCRRIVWGQSVKILQDFGKGIKQSFKQFLGLGLLTGLVLLLVEYAVPASLLVMTPENTFWPAFGMGLAIVFAVIWFVAMMFAFNMSSLYNIDFIRLIIGSFKLTFKRLLRSLGIAILSLAPILVFMFMPWAFVQIIGYAVTIVFSLGFAGVLQTVYCHGVFDDFINKDSYPAYVRMGMRGEGGEEYGVSEDESDTENNSDRQAVQSEDNSADEQEPGEQTESARETVDNAQSSEENIGGKT